jgi:hypothetical protein
MCQSGLCQDFCDFLSLVVARGHGVSRAPVRQPFNGHGTLAGEVKGLCDDRYTTQADLAETYWGEKRLPGRPFELEFCF